MKLLIEIEVPDLTVDAVKHAVRKWDAEDSSGLKDDVESYDEAIKVEAVDAEDVLDMLRNWNWAPDSRVIRSEMTDS
jgi:hypothetical protein